MSIEAKKYLQNTDEFPAQEIWIDNDNNFWAFFVEPGRVLLTEGLYEAGGISYNTIYHYTDIIDAFVDYICEQKRNDGFYCFAIALN